MFRLRQGSASGVHNTPLAPLLYGLRLGKPRPFTEAEMLLILFAQPEGKPLDIDADRPNVCSD